MIKTTTDSDGNTTVTGGDFRVTVAPDEDFVIITTWERSVRGRYKMVESAAVSNSMIPAVVGALLKAAK